MKMAVIVFLMALPVWATAFQVELITSKTECFEGESVIIEIQVFPATPADTVLSVESVPDGMYLAASRKERRSCEDDSPFSNGRVDSVVFVQEWTGFRAGSYRLGPFIIEVNGLEQVLAPVDLLFLERESAGMGELRWTQTDPDVVIRTGEPVFLVLEARHVPEPVSLLAPLPKNALLEKSGETFENRSYSGPDWRPVASFIWTPLFDGNQALPSVELEYRDNSGDVSRARNSLRLVSVVAVHAVEHEESVSPLLAEAFAAADSTSRDDEFSARDYPLPQSLRDPRISALVTAAGYWRNNEYAASLAYLRQLEHSTLFPARIRESRLEAEQVLGITGSLPVPSKPRLQLVLVCFAIFAGLSLVLLFFRRRSRLLTRLWAVSSGCAIVLLAVSVLLLVPVRRSYAVSRGGALRQIPEQTAGITAPIPEGTPVTILKLAGSWNYIRLPASLEGWVFHDDLILYTRAGFHGFW